MTLPERQFCILVVEDEFDLRKVLEYNLREAGYEVRSAPTCAQANALLEAVQPDLVILDLRLPDGSGLDILSRTRSNPSSAETAIVVVSALGDEETVVKALNEGADDYVTKPFRVNELLARVAGILRRRSPSAEPPTPVITCGPISLNVETYAVTVEGADVELTKSEFALLLHLVRHVSKVFTRQQLCFQALESGGAVQERTIDAHIRTIRRKLGDAGRQLVTVWGVGYKIVNPLE